MGSVWLIWLDFDLKVDSNTGGGGGREEEEEWGAVRAENGLGFENGSNKISGKT